MNTTPYPKRLIEVDLPIKRISAHARREKSIRHGHISTLHIWWARRPLAACRAVICAALWLDPADDLCPQEFVKIAKELMLNWAKKHQQKASADSFNRLTTINQNPEYLDNPYELRRTLLDFIADFANWDNSTDADYLETSRKLTQTAHEALGGIPGTKPLVVDPFAGGGAIPLEALRVGADAFASDLNPVAVLLNKVVLEYIPKYGQKLADEVRKWGQWVKEEAEKELAEFYPKDADGSTPIAYLWARTIICEGPGCGAEVPLIRSLWLAKKEKASVTLQLIPNISAKAVNFRIMINKGDIWVDSIDLKQAIRNPNFEGTVRRGAVTCPCCGYTTPAKNVRKQFEGRKGGLKDAYLISVVTSQDGIAGKNYRVGNAKDIEMFHKTINALSELIKNDSFIVPQEPLPYLRSIFNIQLIDVNQWGELFNTRQILTLATFVKIIQEFPKIIAAQFVEPDFKTALTTCLAIIVDRLAAQLSSLCRWQPKGEFVVGTFSRQDLGIIWDFAEIRPFAGASGDFEGAINWVVRVLESAIDSETNGGNVAIASAINHPLPDDSAMAVITDPPYYDAVPYADISDFFYVFLKRMLKKQHSELFVNELTPKNGEIVQLAERNKIYSYKTKKYFEDGLKHSLLEARRILSPIGLSVVIFAHKTTEAWEVMLSSLIDSGWTVTSSWTIDTERSVRTRANQSAALASSVHLVCRPRNTDNIGDWRDVLQQLPQRIHEWMPRLAAEGVVGADAIFACLGPALEIFSRYSSVEKASGEEVTLKEYLEYVWAAVSKEALGMIFSDADATGFEEDARLTAMWLWTLSAGNSTDNGDNTNNGSETDNEDEEETSSKSSKTTGYILEFDAARKIAQGLGAHLENLTQLVEVKGSKASLLPVSERTQYLFGKEEAKTPTKRKKNNAKQLNLFDIAGSIEDEDNDWGEKNVPQLGNTVLDRIHQSMILFAAGRSEALKRFLVEEGAGDDQRFWRLAQALSALYPNSTDEKRWVDGVLARKKGMGF